VSGNLGFRARCGWGLAGWGGGRGCPVHSVQGRSSHGII
jgi:hypothetical protein